MFKKWNRRKNNTFWTVIWQGQYSCLDFWERPTIRFLADLVAKDLLQLGRSCGVQHLPHVGQFSSNSRLISITTTTSNSQLSLLLQVGRLRRWLVLLLFFTILFVTISFVVTSLLWRSYRNYPCRLSLFQVDCVIALCPNFIKIPNFCLTASATLIFRV